MRFLLSKTGLLLLLWLTFAQQGYAKPKVIGYLPSYQNIKSQVDQIDLTKITHLILAFLHPNKQGEFVRNEQPSCMVGYYGQSLSSAEISYMVNKAKQAGVKVLISVGGASFPECAGNWLTLLSSQYRANTINNLLEFIERYQFDGLDIDLEGKLLTDLDKNGDFLPFIQTLSKQLSVKEKLLSAATGSYIGGMLPESTLTYFDFVSIMSYDAIGPSWGKPGVEHSTFDKAKADVALWLSKGLEKEKLILGLPFYGYGFGQFHANYAFSDIVNEFGHKMSSGDLIGKRCSDCSYISFNGYQTIAAKTELAVKTGGGVMIWELSKDKPSNKGLLNTIDSTIKRLKNNTP